MKERSKDQKEVDVIVFKKPTYIQKKKQKQKQKVSRIHKFEFLPPAVHHCFSQLLYNIILIQ